MKNNTFKYRMGQFWNKKLAFQRNMPYLPGQAVAMNARCPLCQGDDSGGHILGGCKHKDMTKQFIARHDKAMRAVIQSFTKGKHGSYYLIANVGQDVERVSTMFHLTFTVTLKTCLSIEALAETATAFKSI